MEQPQLFEEIEVQLVDHMGSDINIVNAARVSFAKEVAEFNLETDSKLIKYLIKNNHWSPLAHTSIQVRCRVPLFLARQLVKHCVGGVWNEESRRYIDSQPSFWLPQEFHNKPSNAKQGAGEVCEHSDNVKSFMLEHSIHCLNVYNDLLESSIAPEEARMVLPLNTNTNFMWTGSLPFFMRVIGQRTDSHAQNAAQEFGHKLYDAIKVCYPHTMQAYEELK